MSSTRPKPNCSYFCHIAHFLTSEGCGSGTLWSMDIYIYVFHPGGRIFLQKSEFWKGRKVARASFIWVHLHQFFGDVYHLFKRQNVERVEISKSRKLIRPKNGYKWAFACAMFTRAHTLINFRSYFPIYSKCWNFKRPNLERPVKLIRPEN